MITAVDSCVILDVLLDDPDHAGRSMAALSRGRREGMLVVCDFVVAEIAPVVGDRIADLLGDFGLHHLPCSLETSILAGRGFAEYLSKGGKRGRIVADFLIAAHTTLQTDRLLTRDAGFRRGYFQPLEIWYP
jgi:predicted nucleic acid-binding protein